MTPTRRNIVAGALALAAGAILPAAAAMAAPVTLPTPDPLIALYAAWRRAERRLQRIWSRRDEAEGGARQAGFIINAGFMTVGDHACTSVGEVVRAAREAGFSPERERELAGEYRKREAEARRERRRAGLASYDAEEQDAAAEWHRALRIVAATPATTVAGLAVKLRFIKEDIEGGPSVVASRMLRSALADAERLASGGTAA